jgi:hypothetical protein
LLHCLSAFNFSFVFLLLFLNGIQQTQESTVQDKLPLGALLLRKGAVQQYDAAEADLQLATNCVE